MDHWERKKTSSWTTKFKLHGLCLSLSPLVSCAQPQRLHFSFINASSSHLWAALADSSLANDSPTREEYFSTNKEEADCGPASRIGRDGAVLFLEESRALVEPEFVRFVYGVGLLCGVVDTLPSWITDRWRNGKLLRSPALVPASQAT